MPPQDGKDGSHRQNGHTKFSYTLSQTVHAMATEHIGQRSGILKNLLKHATEREQSIAHIRAAARYTRNDERSSKQFLYDLRAYKH